MLEDVSADNILIFSMVSSCGKTYKHFIGYKDDDYKIESLCIMLPKMSVNVKIYDGGLNGYDSLWTIL